MTKMEERDQNSNFVRRMFEQLMDLFITPEVKRRQQSGKLAKPLDLQSAQIIFFPDGRRPEVRINSEVKAIGQVRLKPEISKKAGESVFEHELEGLENVYLTQEDDPDCAHVTLFRVGARWIITLDLRYNKALSRKHVETAKQFYEAAKFSFDRRFWSPFIDNLFSAAELAARATLLSMPDPKLRKKAKHKAIHIRYNQFADLGNVKPVFRETFNKLSGQRTPARYLKGGNISVSEKEARELLDIVKNMIQDASHGIDAH